MHYLLTKSYELSSHGAVIYRQLFQIDEIKIATTMFHLMNSWSINTAKLVFPCNLKSQVSCHWWLVTLVAFTSLPFTEQIRTSRRLMNWKILSVIFYSRLMTNWWKCICVRNVCTWGEVARQVRGAAKSRSRLTIHLSLSHRRHTCSSPPPTLLKCVKKWMKITTGRRNISHLGHGQMHLLHCEVLHNYLVHEKKRTQMR